MTRDAGPSSFRGDRPRARNPSRSSIAPPRWPDYLPARRIPDTNRQARAAYADPPWRSPSNESDFKKQTARSRLTGCAPDAFICRLNRLILTDREDLSERYHAFLGGTGNRPSEEWETGFGQTAALPTCENGMRPPR